MANIPIDVVRLADDPGEPYNKYKKANEDRLNADLRRLKETIESAYDTLARVEEIVKDISETAFPKSGGEITGDVTFDSSILTSLGDLSKTGTFRQHNPSAVSVASSTWTNVAQLALTKGVWLLFYTAAFSASSTGRRQSIIATAADSTSPINYMVRDSENAVVDAMTYLDSVDVRTVGSGGATYYLNVWQNSGAALSTIGRLYAIRIC